MRHKKRTVILIKFFTFLILFSSLPGQGTGSFDSEAECMKAFEYLNKVRANPEAFSAEIGVSLKGIKPLPALIWDERLARSAQKKAGDMAGRNYFSHVSPDGIGANYIAQQEGYVFPDYYGTGKSNNYIESISAGALSGPGHIINLLNDGGASNAAAGHRCHLLGLKDFWAKHIHAGIGMAYNPASTYKYYFVVHTGEPGN